MKKLFITLALIFCAVTSQATFRWGPTVGMNVTHFSWKQKLIPTNDAVGFNAGLMGEVMIPGIGFGIDFAVKYAMVGADADFGKKLVWSSDGWGKENVRLHTIQVPLNLRFKWTRLNGVEDIVAPFAYAGPLFQFQCSSTQKGLFDIPAGSVGVQVGIGAEFLKRIQLSAGYHFGLTYALKTVKLENISAKTSNWQINLAYLFGK
ncbi:MAG: PorT family protein [Bacteroidales bacterium]|nr:PorT family protein [Bacteroidales bacterium]MBD5283430.1 PorT family protein [Bacteroides sp.]